MDAPRLYHDLAAWWPLLSAPEDYEEEAAFYYRLLAGASTIPLRDVLELGSGGGNNASHLKAHFRMMLTDVSPGMLEVSRSLNPDCEHLQGDMRTVRVGRQFDAVFVHDAVCYMTTESDVRQSIETAFVHCKPGGAVLFCPDHTRENFRPGTNHGGHDGPDGRALRYIGWTWDPDPHDTTYTTDYAYVLRSPDGTVTVEHDRHIDGLFSRNDWLRWMEAAGFRSHGVLLEHSEVEPGSSECFVGVRPAG